MDKDSKENGSTLTLMMFGDDIMWRIAVIQLGPVHRELLIISLLEFWPNIRLLILKREVLGVIAYMVDILTKRGKTEYYV